MDWPAGGSHFSTLNTSYPAGSDVFFTNDPFPSHPYDFSASDTELPIAGLSFYPDSSPTAYPEVLGWRAPEDVSTTASDPSSPHTPYPEVLGWRAPEPPGYVTVTTNPPSSGTWSITPISDTPSPTVHLRRGETYQFPRPLVSANGTFEILAVQVGDPLPPIPELPEDPLATPIARPLIIVEDPDDNIALGPPGHHNVVDSAIRSQHPERIPRPRSTRTRNPYPTSSAASQRTHSTGPSTLSHQDGQQYASQDQNPCEGILHFTAGSAHWEPVQRKTAAEPEGSPAVTHEFLFYEGNGAFSTLPP
ncbi:hypothetical protein CERSUDRAFT_111926 [Gelatoporia subvermispora B]|uniref:Uncharacterized protein n=1 Tax=Ceriporiopsis subvermispora (strain B) TaxID=914234 RepID=M2QRA6_CERS8|nr:hypothetical protein CERSUDRAFT_111926 [Gelatoporia subvermispora B]